MSFETLRSAIESRLQANWTETDVAYENKEFDATQADPQVGFVSLTILGERGATRGIKGTTFSVSDHGLISFNVFTTPGSGTRLGRVYADGLCALFEHKVFDNVLTYSATLRTLGIVGNWHQFNLTIPFRRDRDV